MAVVVFDTPAAIGIIAPMVYKAKEDDEKEDGRSVRGFKVVHVFDVSQTEGDDLPEFASIGGEPGEKLAALIDVVRSLDIELEIAPMFGTAKGVSMRGKIVIDDTLESGEQFAVLAHDVAHEFLHNKERRRNDDKKVLETEAEAVAFVVCNACGLDSSRRSADYIQLYQGDDETLASSLEAIQKVAESLITEIEARAPSNVAKSHEEAAPSVTVVSANDDIADDELVVGRADYEERREARIDRYEERAQRARQQSTASFERAHRMADAIPFGQPILVGHHSEKRDRRYRGRIQSTFEKAVDLEVQTVAHGDNEQATADVQEPEPNSVPQQESGSECHPLALGDLTNTTAQH